MRTVILILTILLPHFVPAADKLTRAIEKGVVTSEMLKALTYDDVPDKWRSKVEDMSTERYIRRAFWRGQQKVLEVLWSREWTGTKSNMFTATIYDGKRQLCKIMKLSDGNTSVSPPPKDSRSYNLTTSVKEDGRMSVMVMNDEGYFETVEVRGRDTHLLDDLEYTKVAVGIEQFVKPLLEAVEEQFGRKPKKPQK